MAYRAGRFQGDPSSVEAVSSFVQGELEEIEAAFFDLDMIQFVTQNVAPTKPREGMTALADGTNWDPGGGQGLYIYYASAWNKLG